MEKKQITVTSPLLPPLDEFVEYLRDVWNRKWITNNGYYHQELEKALCTYLGIEYISVLLMEHFHLLLLYKLYVYREK